MRHTWEQTKAWTDFPPMLAQVEVQPTRGLDLNSVSLSLDITIV